MTEFHVGVLVGGFCVLVGMVLSVLWDKYCGR